MKIYKSILILLLFFLVGCNNNSKISNNNPTNLTNNIQTNIINQKGSLKINIIMRDKGKIQLKWNSINENNKGYIIRYYCDSENNNRKSYYTKNNEISYESINGRHSITIYEIILPNNIKRNMPLEENFFVNQSNISLKIKDSNYKKFKFYITPKIIKLLDVKNFPETIKHISGFIGGCRINLGNKVDESKRRSKSSTYFGDNSGYFWPQIYKFNKANPLIETINIVIYYNKKIYVLGTYDRKIISLKEYEKYHGRLSLADYKNKINEIKKYNFDL